MALVIELFTPASRGRHSRQNRYPHRGALEALQDTNLSFEMELVSKMCQARASAGRLLGTSGCSRESDFVGN